MISIHALVKRATHFKKSDDLKNGISIHALVKRATRFIVYIIHLFCISIHALVKRATYKRTRTKACYRHFNPRPREEGDRRTAIPTISAGNFNPRPREEGDTRRNR